MICIASEVLAAPLTRLTLHIASHPLTLNNISSAAFPSFDQAFAADYASMVPAPNQAYPERCYIGDLIYAKSH
jgi:hypothetical protein